MTITVTDNYTSNDDTTYDRASFTDFNTVRGRIFERIIRKLGHKNSNGRVLPGVNAYNLGKYADALDVFESAIHLFPAIADELQPHIVVCRRVLASELTRGDLEYERTLQRWQQKPRLLKLISRGPLFKVRCKHCGRYTPYVDPDAGFAYMGTNNCARCGLGYPTPDFAWDGIDGQAYTYYRGSVSPNESFYRQFEETFNVDPVVRLVEGKWTKIPRNEML